MLKATQAAITSPPTHFYVFPDGHGHWRTEKDDHTIAGLFSNRDAAIRFAQREGLDVPDCRVDVIVDDRTPR